MSIRDHAHEFLAALERSLMKVPPAAEMEVTIRKTVALAKKDEHQKHLRLPEAAFLNGYVIPALFKVLQDGGGLSEAAARAALLNEYHRQMPKVSGGSPIRATKHPFSKGFEDSAETIYRRWRSPEKGRALTQSAPDFATLAPHRILFEGKYFARGSKSYAAKELVRNIYQAFFYRGLPRVEATRKHPEWNYDYACLLAYDASRDGALLSAWRDVDARVRKSFWDGANLYVMILGGQGH